MTLLEKILADAVEAGAVRPGFEHEDTAGVILSTIMFNAAYASTISDTEDRESTQAAEGMWQLISGGIVTAPPA